MTYDLRQRDSGIELFRILMICGVIIGHYCNSGIGGGFAAVEVGSFNNNILIFLTSMAMIAVNGFVMISGYFMCTNNKRYLSRALELFAQLILYQEINYMCQAIAIGEPINMRFIVYNLFPCDYFIVLYVFLYITSPYLNVILQRLTQEQYVVMLVIFGIFCSLWNYMADIAGDYFNSTMRGLSGVGYYGKTGFGYTFTTFLLMYIIGGFIRMHADNFKLKNWIFAAIYFVLTIITFTWVKPEFYGGASDPIAWTFNNPVIILSTVAAFYFFKNIHFHSAIVNSLARCTLIVYIVQSPILKHIDSIKWAVDQPTLIMLLHIAGIVCITYLAGYCIYLVYKYSLGKVFEKIQTPLERELDISVKVKD